MFFSTMCKAKEQFSKFNLIALLGALLFGGVLCVVIGGNFADERKFDAGAAADSANIAAAEQPAEKAISLNDENGEQPVVTVVMVYVIAFMLIGLFACSFFYGGRHTEILQAFGLIAMGLAVVWMIQALV